MLSFSHRLSCDIDGRYASDTELLSLMRYRQTFQLRLQTYLKLQELESTIIQQAYLKLRSMDSSFFRYGGADFSSKWRQDTIRVWRYIAVAVLLDDLDTLKERLLLWFQTIVRAFAVQTICEATYRILQELARQYLTPAQAQLVCPILEMSRCILGQSSC